MDWHSHIWRGREHRPAKAVIASGFEALDRRLPGGGWPVGALTEILIERYGLGELALLMPAMARLQRSQEEQKWVVWVAPPFIPYAPALAKHGIDVSKVLLVHPSSGPENRLWAIEQALRSASCAAVVAWVELAREIALRRLQLMAEARRCWAVLFRPASAMRQSSPAALRLEIFNEAAVTRARIIKNRGGCPAVVDLDFSHVQGVQDANPEDSLGGFEWH